MKRACVFVFYDKDGIADEYLRPYLSSLGAHVSRLLIVSNCEPTDEAKALFADYTNEVYVRENVGFDAAAYKFGLQQIGWDEIPSYDEVILANDTVFGPVYPLGDMFEEMSNREADFWGITRHDEHHDDFTRVNPYGYIPAHIQTYFLVMRGRLLDSDILKAYWEGLPEIKTWEDAVGRHEAYFTKYLEDRGFTWDVYINNLEVDPEYPNPTLLRPLLLLRDAKSPFVKCKLFNTDTLEINAGEQVPLAFDYIKTSTDYDEDLILQRIIRIFHQYDIVKALSLTYILPEKLTLSRPAQKRSKTALIMHLYFPDMFEEALHYAKSMPDDADLYITTNTQDKAEKIAVLFEEIANEIEVRLVENRGRSESALLVGMADIIDRYEILCFWKEKKSAQSGLDLAASWAYKINENLLPSKEFVENVLSTFEANPRLGLLVPPPPHHSIWFPLAGGEWTENYSNTVALAAKLGLKVPFDKKKAPICPFGGAFWFRGAALSKLFQQGWDYDDFPEEPLDIDGTFLHAIERIYPYVSQDAGYYPAFVMTDGYASLEYTDLRHYLREINSVFVDMDFSFYTYKHLIWILKKHMRFAMSTRRVKEKIKRGLKPLPDPIYIFARGIKRIAVGPNRSHPFAGKVDRN
ncbi:MAG: rhamnan synthesis F family protein [Clostridiales Family XIII bacterium]|jgi:rhamnosyltransferase|nr:rhamnan synthesis F family protein [Clostridiales Family XIII bacterium]